MRDLVAVGVVVDGLAVDAEEDRDFLGIHHFDVDRGRGPGTLTAVVSVLRHVLVAVAACFGVVCIGAGMQCRNPPVRGSEEGMYHALGDGYGKLLAWPAIVLGTMLLLGAALYLGAVLRRLMRGADPDPGGAATAAPLPEARAHFTPPDERNGK